MSDNNNILNNIDRTQTWVDVETVAKLKGITKRGVRLSLNQNKYEYRKPIFIENIDILRTAFKNTKTIYEFEIIAICVLPNHIHLILHQTILNNIRKLFLL